ncbi:hypothetical protein EJ04DRAFT_610344 [Polyplosphaeria fusca]|uniref:Uncharacterized protein n=1 Tax=Polyplosphaeria fusca TaxID=682080 RepID=A0A9P4QU07_9PLEO|nr:hypothetical protein EJ04DRAFT_610344 [Polyplosphaeria fusca]
MAGNLVRLPPCAGRRLFRDAVRGGVVILFITKHGGERRRTIAQEDISYMARTGGKEPQAGLRSVGGSSSSAATAEWDGAWPYARVGITQMQERVRCSGLGQSTDMCSRDLAVDGSVFPGNASRAARSTPRMLCWDGAAPQGEGRAASRAWAWAWAWAGCSKCWEGVLAVCVGEQRRDRRLAGAGGGARRDWAGGADGGRGGQDGGSRRGSWWPHDGGRARTGSSTVGGQAGGQASGQAGSTRSEERGGGGGGKQQAAERSGACGQTWEARRGG